MTKSKPSKPLTQSELEAEVVENLKRFTRSEPYITNTAKIIIWLVQDNLRAEQAEGGAE